MPTKKTIILKKLGQLLWLGTITFVLSVIAGTTLYVFAAFTEPAAGPASSDQDFTENIIGANNDNNDFNSTLVAANNDGSIIERIEYIGSEYCNNFDTTQMRYTPYDDWNCSNNNQELDSACAAGDAEYTGEEGEWTYYYDSDLNGAEVASSTVYKDERTGLYWSDCHDNDSGGGACLDILNGYADVVDICSDAEINGGGCDINTMATSSAAIDVCQALVLDKDGDGTDDTNWYLPSQKELMQAYINGAANNLPHVSGDNYWSSTEYYGNPAIAWNVDLSNGSTYSNGSKTTSTYYVRCIHR